MALALGSCGDDSEQSSQGGRPNPPNDRSAPRVTQTLPDIFKGDCSKTPEGLVEIGRGLPPSLVLGETTKEQVIAKFGPPCVSDEGGLEVYEQWTPGYDDNGALESLMFYSSDVELDGVRVGLTNAKEVVRERLRSSLTNESDNGLAVVACEGDTARITVIVIEAGDRVGAISLARQDVCPAAATYGEPLTP